MLATFSASWTRDTGDLLALISVDVQRNPHIDCCQCARMGPCRGPKPSAPIRRDLCCPSLVDTPLDEDEAAELGRVLAALGDPVRLRLLSLVASGTEVCSCDLERPLGKTQPTISHHTKVLVEAGLLIGEKRGRWVWWRVDETRFAAIRKTLGG